MSDPNLLTTEELERERDALDLVLAGITGALGVVPEASIWRPALLDMRSVLRARLGDLGPMAYLADES